MPHLWAFYLRRGFPGKTSGCLDGVELAAQGLACPPPMSPETGVPFPLSDLDPCNMSSDFRGSCTVATSTSAAGDPTGGPELLSDSSVESEPGDGHQLCGLLPEVGSLQAARSLTASLRSERVAGCAAEIRGQTWGPPQGPSGLLTRVTLSALCCKPWTAASLPEGTSSLKPLRLYPPWAAGPASPTLCHVGHTRRDPCVPSPSYT